MANVSSFRFPSADGIHQIYARQWRPDGEVRAVVQIVHGISEHIGRYDRLAKYLAQHGILVCGEDHLGHGRTALEEDKGYFAPHDGWTMVTADVRRLRQMQGEKYPGLPCFLLGHSMGSFLVRTYLCRYPGEVSGAILSGTGQEPDAAVAFGRGLTEVLCRRKRGNYVSPLILNLTLGAYNKRFAPNRTDSDWISRDEAEVDCYLADPFCAYRSTVGLFKDMMDGLRYISRPWALKQMDPDTPVCFISGGDDPVGGMGKGIKKVYSFFERQGVKDLTLKLYPGGRHEMFNETNRKEVMDDLLTWLEKHLE